MNTGFVRPAVATVPTVYGIETIYESDWMWCQVYWLQQYLPFTVLKQLFTSNVRLTSSCVATVPTACGIETFANARLVVDNL